MGLFFLFTFQNGVTKDNKIKRGILEKM